MEIKVLGPGCPKCHEAEKLVREAVAEAGVPAQVTKVSDFKEMAMLGVFATPAVVVDGVVKCSGKVPSKKEILAWLGK
ncbi:MAG: thioredoxin family protein [Humidesulfovibrio sp.]|jgi:small redox-active disulfide protein 2|uniref:thioredoxin family protein n=1 Tax=Humidesulfovibrio sp. TaxID=2910988 RepID=UPI0027373676|nr:thioredoxin family protein [Humidesulfovibrio sp.]MDP2847505.1 thioredoxin family protein [Humidesulfovibrio sp.]